MFTQRPTVIVLICAIGAVALPLVCWGQTAGTKPEIATANRAHPDYGVINGKHYLNGYFGFSYRYPEGWQGNVVQSSNSSTSYMYTLFSANPPASAGPDMRYLTISVDALKPTDTPKIFMEASIKTVTGPSGAFDLAHADQHYTFGGKQFYRIDLVSKPAPGSPAVYEALVFAMLPNYAVTFSFMATNHNDIEDMVRSMESISFVEPAHPAPTPIRAATGSAQPQAR